MDTHSSKGISEVPSYRFNIVMGSVIFIPFI